jgi:hypothetical protein
VRSAGKDTDCRRGCAPGQDKYTWSCAILRWSIRQPTRRSRRHQSGSTKCLKLGSGTMTSADRGSSRYLSVSQQRPTRRRRPWFTHRATHQADGAKSRNKTSSPPCNRPELSRSHRRRRFCCPAFEMARVSPLLRATCLALAAVRAGASPHPMITPAPTVDEPTRTLLEQRDILQSIGGAVNSVFSSLGSAIPSCTYTQEPITGPSRGHKAIGASQVKHSMRGWSRSETPHSTKSLRTESADTQPRRRGFWCAKFLCRLAVGLQGGKLAGPGRRSGGSAAHTGA